MSKAASLFAEVHVAAAGLVLKQIRGSAVFEVFDFMHTTPAAVPGLAQDSFTALPASSSHMAILPCHWSEFAALARQLEIKQQHPPVLAHDKEDKHSSTTQAGKLLPLGRRRPPTPPAPKARRTSRDAATPSSQAAGKSNLTAMPSGNSKAQSEG